MQGTIIASSPPMALQCIFPFPCTTSCARQLSSQGERHLIMEIALRIANQRIPDRDASRVEMVEDACRIRLEPESRPLS
jgi:hypothetical protein